MYHLQLMQLQLFWGKLLLNTSFITIVIGVALLFQYNLKLSKLAQAKWIEDINDEDEEKEEEIGPIALMNDIFPFDGRPQTINKRATYIRSHDANAIMPTSRAPLYENEYIRSKDDQSAEMQERPVQMHVNQINSNIQMHVSMRHSHERLSAKSSNASMIEKHIYPTKNDNFVDMTDKLPNKYPSLVEATEKNPKDEELLNQKLMKKTEKIVRVGEIESDYTEDDFESHQDINASGSTAPQDQLNSKRGNLPAVQNIRNQKN